MFLDWDALNVFVQALGWALIHFLWQGAAIGAFFALSMRLLRNGAPAPRYWIGLASMGALAAAPVVTFFIVFPGIEQSGVAESYALGAMGVGSMLGSADPESAFSWAGMIERFLPWVVAAWALGVSLHSTRVFVKWRRMRQLTRIGVRQPSQLLLDKAAALRELFGIRRAVSILESTLVEVPTVMGWLKPVILLPTASLIGLSPRQLELVIAHELSHVRRWDYLVNLVQVCVETALFYHPVVGWISRRVREEREKCCDDLVVETCGNRLEYAKALTNLESIRSGDVVPALAATDGQLFERIERIVCNHAAEPRDAVAGNTLFLVIVGLTVVVTGRFADPLGAFEAQRARIGDALVNELLLATVPQHSEALLAPLENARVSVFEDEPEPAPVDRVKVVAETAEEPVAQSVVTETREAPAPPADVSGAAASAEPQSGRQASERAIADPQVVESARSKPFLSTQPELDIPRPANLLVTGERIRQPEARPVDPGPEVLVRVSPEYPVRARLSGQKGYVEVAFAINAEGRPTEIEIVDSRPRRVFDRAALRAIKQWRFDTASVAAADVDRISQRFDFNLSAGEGSFSGVRECQPLTGTRICRSESPTSLMAQEATSP